MEHATYTIYESLYMQVIIVYLMYIYTWVRVSGHCGNYSKKKVVGRVGVEPTTLGLKVPCSTNWANDPTWRGKTPSKRNNHIMTAARLRECLIIFLQVAAFCAKNCRISSNMKITTHTPKRLPRFPPCRQPKPVLPSCTTPRRKNGVDVTQNINFSTISIS